MELVFATHNLYKLQEISNMLNNRFRIISLDDIGFMDEIPETHSTLEENASQKTNFLFRHFKCNCFADDTGLEVYALHGEPGVMSARYAGPGKNFDDNIEKLLDKLTEINDRQARFRTVISLLLDNEEIQFEGIVEGEILREKRGKGGFGYDPVFLPKGKNLTFAQMSLEEKNKISHRGQAFGKMADYLLYLDQNEKR